MQEIYRKKDGEKEQLGKEKRIVCGQRHLREEKEKNFYYMDCLFFLWGMERAQVMDNLTHT